MARVMLIPRGHASTQLKIVRQRHTPSASAMIWSRSSPAWSRLSKMKRWALTIAAGPTKSGFDQKDGQAVVHAPHRMHLEVSSNRSRSSGDWRRSFPSAGTSSLTRYGITERYFSQNPSRSTSRSLMTCEPRIGSTLISVPASLTRYSQASRLRPLMSIASEPQTPWAHERRKVSVPSWYHFTWWSRSSTRSLGSACTVYSSQWGSGSRSGSKRLRRSRTSMASVDPRLRRELGDRHRPVCHPRRSALRPAERERVLEPLDVVTIGEVLAGVPPAGLRAGQG